MENFVVYVTGAWWMLSPRVLILVKYCVHTQLILIPMNKYHVRTRDFWLGWLVT